MGFTSFELRLLNHCRLFLNVISISDIASEPGKSLDPTVMKLKKLPSRQSDPRFYQSKPDHIKWSIWFKFITNITRKRQSSLKQLWGNWIVNYRLLQKHYTCYRTTDKAYKEREGEICAQNITNIAGTEWAGLSQEVVTSIPMEAIPCMQSYIGWLYTGYSKEEEAQNNSHTNSMLQQYNVTFRSKHIRGDPVKKYTKGITNGNNGKMLKKKTWLKV